MQKCKFAPFAIVLTVIKLHFASPSEPGYDIESRAKNVAQFQTSKQSSLSDTLNPSSLAIDDNPVTCSKTGSEKDASWSVDLKASYPIAAVLINAGDAFFGPNSEVYISDDPSNEGTLCNYGPQSEAATVHVLTCLNGPPLGRSVTVKNKFNGGLRLCDVKVMVCNDGYYGSGCALDCHCLDGRSCHKVTGDCPGLCSPGWMGQGCQTVCQDGHFGPSCKKSCHCKGGANCSVTDGSCQDGCDDFWVGPSCQTAVPKLKEGPSLRESRTTEITVRWPAWTAHLDESIALYYLVEYRPSDYHGNETSRTWLEGVVTEQKAGEAFVQASVTSLKPNHFYEFRVVPVLRMGEVADGDEADRAGREIRGIISPESAPFKTKCNAPEAPNITSLHSWSTEQHAIVNIQWTLLSKSQSNCDNIQHYEILYRKADESTWKTVVSVHTSWSVNVTGLDFDSDYWFVVVAHNNQPLDSSSARKSFTTVNDVQALRSTEQPTPKVGMMVGMVMVVSGALVVVVILIGLLYKRQLKKYNSIPQQEIEGKVLPGRGGGGAIQSISEDYRSHPSKSLTEAYIPATGNGDDDGYDNDVAFSPDPPFPFQPKHFLYENGRLPGGAKEVLTPCVPPVERHPIAVKDLEEHIKLGKENDSELLRKEFKEIPDSNQEATSASGTKTENRYKNRFINILPYDHSRVILNKSGGIDASSDYVNANYIDGYKKPKAYIASQGCNKWTIQDMWRMVWQADARRIVMVTNLVEKGRVKCEQYWCDREQEEVMYGNLGVTLVDVERTSDYIIRTFNVRLREVSEDACGDLEHGETVESRVVKQFHYVAWPDHGVPDRAGPIISFRRKVRLHDHSHPGVILVHCSAGVGRTGAFIALDCLLERSESEGSVDLFNYTCSMRRDRVNMIQTLDQYIFVYDALLEALKVGNTIIGSADFAGEFEKMNVPNHEGGKSKLEKEFELLDSLSYKGKPEDYTLGDIPENKEKNRFPDILPADKHRPYLMTRVQGTNDYINAVYLDGYRSKNAYVSTQMPMTHTVIDLWRLVHELHCGTVVMLNLWDEQDDTYGQYWSEENEECECGPFMIEATSINRDNPDITVRELKLTFTPPPPPAQSSPTPKNNNNNNNNKADEPEQLKVQQQQQLTVNHFQLNATWPSSGGGGKPVPTTPLKIALISLLEMVEKSQMKTGNRPVVVHCRDGVTHSGLFVAISCIVERLKDEQEVEVFQTVRKLKDHRPAIIRDFDQYKFCYEMVLAYLTEFSIYSNFR